MFNQTHETKDGKVMMIAEMKNDHLKNTVNMLLDKLKAAKAALDNTQTVSNFEKVLYGFDPVKNQKQAEKIVANVMAMLPPYILECVIRGIDYGPQLRIILKRAECEVVNPFTMFNQSNSMNLLPGSNSVGNIEKAFLEEEIREFEDEEYFDNPF